jgi:hypothetical protein
LEDIEVSETVTRRDHAERVREYYRQQGAEREQQRIIKLLEAEGVKQQTGLDSPEWHLGEIIALIKGDK